MTPEEITAIGAFLKDREIRVLPMQGDRVFYINVTLLAENHSACCEIVDYHTNITRIQRDEEVLFQKAGGESETPRRQTAPSSASRRSSALQTVWTRKMSGKSWSARSPITPPSRRRGSGAAGAQRSAGRSGRFTGMMWPFGPRRRPPPGRTPG